MTNEKEKKFIFLNIEKYFAIIRLVAYRHTVVFLISERKII